MQIFFSLSKIIKNYILHTILHKIGQWGGFLGRLLGPLLKTGLPLMKNVLKTSAKSVLFLLVLTALAVADAAVHKKLWIWYDMINNC